MILSSLSTTSISYLVCAKFFLLQGGRIRFSTRSFSLKSTAFRIYSKSIRILDIPVPTRPAAAAAAAAARPFYYPRAEKKEGEPEKEKEEEEEEEGEEGEEEMASAREDVRARLLEHFPNGTSDTPDRWAMLWDKGDFLPWDIGTPNPALGDVLTDRKELFGTCFKEEEEEEEEDKEGGSKVQRKRALVPGCGRGYDVILLASFGYDAYGLEVSDKAVELCVQEQQKNGDKYPVKDESVGYGTVTFLKGDFFRDEWTEKIPGGGKFDLIYDYTFLCALPPTLRPSWAKRQTELLATQPAGILLCLEFPSYKDPLTKGPPFGLRPEVYLEHLGHPGREVPYGDDGHVKEGALGDAEPDTLQRIAHFQPRRTHQIGMGTDWISVWRR